MMLIAYDPSDFDKVTRAHQYVKHTLECSQCHGIAMDKSNAEAISQMFQFIRSIAVTADEADPSTAKAVELELYDWERALMILDRWMVCHTIEKDVDGVLTVLERLMGLNEQPTLH